MLIELFIVSNPVGAFLIVSTLLLEPSAFVGANLNVTEKQFCRGIAEVLGNSRLCWEEFHDGPELLANARFFHGLHRAVFIETAKTCAMDLHVLQASELISQGRFDPTEQS